eukprot:349914-Chlamydomonas_euryale.AAC.4
MQACACGCKATGCALGVRRSVCVDPHHHAAACCTWVPGQQVRVRPHVLHQTVHAASTSTGACLPGCMPVRLPGCMPVCLHACMLPEHMLDACMPRLRAAMAT